MVWLSLGLVALAFTACAPTNGDPTLRRAPMADDAHAANQLVVSGNACGPAALLNSLRFSDDRWRKTLTSIDGETDRNQLITIIRRHGLRPSPHLGGRPRWSRKGVNVVDLTDIANEITSPRGLPKIRHDILISNSIESPEQQVRRTHRQLEKSLARGLPPMLSVRRIVQRRNADGMDEWMIIDAHFVTVVEVPRRLPRNADAFTLGYIDPWGARHEHGEIRVSRASPGFPEADFPQANIGKAKLRPGEKSILAASAMIGSF